MLANKFLVKNKFQVFTLGIICLSTMIYTSCNSGSTADSADTDTSSIFVSDDDTAGSLSLEITNSGLAVASTTSFRVVLQDLNNEGVPSVTISCDTEEGLALIEPTSGNFFTDSFGSASGVIGCTAPGSFQMACRGPIGFGRRIFASVVCSGDTPAGFTGFPGAGGGGLGGGVDNTDGGSGSDFDLRLTSIKFYDDGGASTTTSIDVVPGICEDLSAEPFFDTTAEFTVQNNSTEIVRFTSYRYRVFNFDLNGNTHTSPVLNFIGEADSITANGGEGTFSALFADAASGGKRFFRRNSNIGQVGFLNIEFTLYGSTSTGTDTQVVGRTSLSFDNFNRCED